MANKRGKDGSSDRFPLLGLQNHCGQWLQSWDQNMIASWQEHNDKKAEALLCWQRSIQSRLWSSQWSQLWDLDYKKGIMPNNWCLWTVVLEKTPESSLDSREMKPGNLKGDQSWIFTGRTDAEAEAPVFWSSDVHRWLIGKVPVTGKDRVQRRRGCHRMRWVDSISNAMNMNLGKLWEIVRDRKAWPAAVHGVKMTGQLNTTTNSKCNTAIASMLYILLLVLL